MADDKSNRLRGRSRALAHGLTAFTVFVAIVFVLENFGSLMPRILAGDGVADLGADFTAAAIQTVPGAIYLWGLWSIRTAFERIAQGALFHPIVGATLDKVGRALAGGAVFSLAAIPSLLRLVGAGPGYLVDFDVATIVIAVIGVFLVVLAGLQRRAAALEAELREFV